VASATIDVRPIEPRDKHTRIFALVDDLSAGETLTIINDHDPVPLKYQLEAEHPGQFTFNYVENGPTQWILEITKGA